MSRHPRRTVKPADRTIRVWSSARDITDENPAAWPWPYSDWYEQGWRPAEGPNSSGGSGGGVGTSALHGT
jgi:hypothetical protein